MAKFFKKEGIGEYVSYLSKSKAIKLHNKTKKEIAFRFWWWMIPLAIFSPVFFFTVAIAAVAYVVRFHYVEFFMDKRRLEKYGSSFAPKTAEVGLTSVGYQVFEDEFDAHINIVKSDDPENIKKLGNKQKRMMKWENMWRWVTFSKKLLTTHLHIVGKTGAGKTELVRAIVNDACFKTGGGHLFLDGKSDTGMLREFITQAYKEGRETSVMVINFLQGEHGGETNTFSPLNIMHPVKTVDFLSGLTGGGEGGGNAKYFQEQGKAMLFPVVNFTYHRNEDFKEGYNLEKIFEGTKLTNLILSRITSYCEVKDLNEIIKTNPLLKTRADSVPMAATDENIKYVELYIEYVTENATEQKLSEQEIGITYVKIRELYINCFLLLDGYLAKMWGQYSGMLDVTSRAMYVMMKNKGHNFYGDDPVGIKDIKAHFAILKSLTEKEDFDKLEEVYGLFSTDTFSDDEQQQLVTALHREPAKGGNITAPPADAVQQLAYAQQQYSPLANIFALFKHVFGQTKPEIDAARLLKDNKFLYTLLPPLSLQPTFTEIIGKMFIATVREIASIALLGKDLSLHSTLAFIHKDKLTPKPFTFIVMDEYGAYAVEGIDILLAQLRSLNISVGLGTQDNVSLKAGGTDEASQQRALANTTKVIAKIEDKEVIDWVRAMLSDINVEKPKMQKDYNDNWAATSDIEISQEKSFDVERLRDFGNGFALVLFGSKEEDLVFMQSFYKGGTPGTIMIRRYLNLDLV